MERHCFETLIPGSVNGFQNNRTGFLPFSNSTVKGRGMCLAVIAYNTHPKYRLIIASNRDEFYSRASTPAHFWDDAPHILAGRDMQHKGTWFGITTRGKLALITNVRDPGAMKSGSPSRGEIVKRYLRQDLSPDAYLEELLSRGKDFSGFNLIFGTVRKLFYYSNHPEHWQEITPGIHALSNANLNTPWPKVEFAKEQLRKSTENNHYIEDSGLFPILFNSIEYPMQKLPDTGVGSSLEKMLSPVFIYSPNYGTRSSSVLKVDYNNQVTLSEKTFDRQEDGDTYQKRLENRANSFSFRVDS